MATKGNGKNSKTTYRIDPVISAAFANVPKKLGLVEPGHLTWGANHVGINVLIPDDRSRLIQLPNSVLTVTLFPIPATRVLEQINSVLQAKREQVEKAKAKQQDISGKLAMQSQLASKASALVEYGKGAFAAQAVSMTIGTEEETVETAEKLVESGGHYSRPVHAWVHAMEGAVPTANCCVYPDPDAFFVATPAIIRNSLPIPRLPRLPKITGNPRFYIGVTNDGEVLTWSPWDAHNPLLGITGFSGSGKSVLGRLLLYQAATLDIQMVVLDPKGEWTAQFRHFPPALRENVMTISTTELFKYSVPQPHVLSSMVAGKQELSSAEKLSTLMSLMSGFPDEYTNTLRSCLNRLVSKVEWEDLTWRDIYESLPEDKREPYAILDPEGAYGTFFGDGEPLPISEKGITVLDMEHLTGSASGDKDTNNAVINLLMMATAERLKSSGTQSIIFFDEAHFLLRLKSAGDTVRVLMRVARSYNVAVALASQYLADLYGSIGGEEPLGGQCAYRALLRTSDNEISDLERYALNEPAVAKAINTLRSTDAGSGLWFGGRGMQPFYVMLPPVAEDFCLA